MPPEDTLILTFSHGEKELALKIVHDTHHGLLNRLPIPLGEGWGEGKKANHQLSTGK